MANNSTAAPKKQNQFLVVLKRLFKRKTAVAGAIILLILTLSAIFAPLIAPYNYTELNVKERLQGPSLRHLCGTDEFGRDLLSRLLMGGRYSLRVGISVVAFSLVFGVILGSLSGYFGGWVDNLIMRFLDIVHAIPGMLLAIMLSALLGNGFGNTILALSVGSINGYARTLRASIMRVRKAEYIEAAATIKASNARIIMSHVLPNSIAPLIVQCTMGCANGILSAASLSYIGLGIQPPEAEWGAMLSGARSYIRDYPHMGIFPGILIALVVLSFNLIGDALRDALDPKLK
ncbi:MAG: ABC transporter permease [Oscillospiraceae bacterium]|nr:ABC transporter permease [Oscillospiraceae bacterium]